MAIDAVALHQTAEGAAIFFRFARGPRDVAIVLAEERLDVGAFEGFECAGARGAEAAVAGRIVQRW
jgi:hypothetical protein